MAKQVEESINFGHDRPDFGPDQVRNVEKIEIGGHYRLLWANGEYYDVEVTSVSEEGWEREMHFFSLNDKKKEDMSTFLCHVSVITNRLGLWHRTNWMRLLTQEEEKEYLSQA